jgi:hypothetical protein
VIAHAVKYVNKPSGRIIAHEVNLINFLRGPKQFIITIDQKIYGKCNVTTQVESTNCRKNVLSIGALNVV